MSKDRVYDRKAIDRVLGTAANRLAIEPTIEQGLVRISEEFPKADAVIRKNMADGGMSPDQMERSLKSACAFELIGQGAKAALNSIIFEDRWIPRYEGGGEFESYADQKGPRRSPADAVGFLRGFCEATLAEADRSFGAFQVGLTYAV